MEAPSALPLPSQHLLLHDEGCELPLRDELSGLGIAISTSGSGWLQVQTELSSQRPLIAFSRQLLPHCQRVQEPSINAWARRLADAAITYLPHSQPWRCHIVPAYGQGSAGQQRCKLIRDALREQLQKKRRALLRTLQEGEQPFAEEESCIQAHLLSPEEGLLSIAPAPLPYTQRQLLWPQPAGIVPIASDKAAPSRAFAKLVEAEARMGQRIQPGQRCVDLGAAPGSWTYVCLQRGAHVTALDRSPLRDDLMRHPRLQFLQADAFKYRPTQPVDWLVCDVIAEPQKLSELLVDWLRGRHTQRFVFTIKFKGDGGYGQLDELKRSLPPLCHSAYLTHLCANKNEVTAFGVLRS
jgi:23S rRNA (cytidine2498-2'-O)-methyltransferase